MTRDHNYRDILYRYSTGMGFRQDIVIPKNKIDYTGKAFVEQAPKQIFCRSIVSLKREADRLSMQYEALLKMLKSFGGSEKSLALLQALSKKLKKMQDLRVTTRIESINKGVLDSYLEGHISKKSLISQAQKELCKRSYPVENFKKHEYDAVGRKSSEEFFDKFYSLGESKPCVVSIIVVSMAVAYLGGLI